MFVPGGCKMNNRVSEIRIQNNKRRRRRQLRKNMTLLFLSMLLSISFSTLFFGMKAKAQDYGKKTSKEQIFFFFLGEAVSLSAAGRSQYSRSGHAPHTGLLRQQEIQ